MISIEPQGTIVLCNVPFDSNQKHNFIFSSETERNQYFATLTNERELYNYTYIRKDSSIKVDLPYDIVKNFNYCYYLNGGFTIHYIFAFIESIEYINENCTKIYIKTDSWQTYGLKISQDTTSSSFIERMIVAKSDDAIGNNLVQENLETGEYIVRAVHKALLDKPNGYDESGSPKFINPYIIVGTTERITGFTYDNLTTSTSENMYNGNYSGISYLAFETGQDVNRFIAYVDSLGKGSAIYSMFMCPSNIMSFGSLITFSSWTYPIKYKNIKIEGRDAHLVDTISINYLSYPAFDLYVPKNNKLYTYPYSYILADNNAGTSAIYKYEYFESPFNHSYNIFGAISQGCSAKLVPLKYKGAIGVNDTESLNVMKFPTCSWNNDVYTNWLTQTAVNRENAINYAKEMRWLGRGKTVTDVVGSLLGGYEKAKDSGLTDNMGIGSSFLKALSTAFSGRAQERTYDEQINNVLASEYEHSLIPNSLSNGGAVTEVNWAEGLYNPYLYEMCITQDFAERIDKYFTRYGYKVNTFKNINDCINTRSKWNYVKTIDCQIEVESIPHENMIEIKEMFNNGVTLWHDPSAIYKYDTINNE